MGIRVVHDAGAMAGLAGYAGGKNRAKARQQKYDQALWMQERRHQQDMERMGGGLKYRNALGGRRAGGGAADGGFWADPLADNEDLDPGIRRQRRAQREARARKGRSGKDVPAEWQPTYTSPAQIEQQQDEAKDKAERQREIEDRDEEREYQEGITAKANTRADRKARAAGLMEVPKWAPKAIGHKLRGEYADIVQMLTGGEIDWNDPDQVEDVEQAIKEYESAVGGLTPPNPVEDYNSTIKHFDPVTGTSYDDPGPGRTPMQIIDGKPVEIPGVVAQKRQQEAEAEEAAAANKLYQDEYLKKWNELTDASEDIEGNYGGPKTPELRKEAAEQYAREQQQRRMQIEQERQADSQQARQAEVQSPYLRGKNIFNGGHPRPSPASQRFPTAEEQSYIDAIGTDIEDTPPGTVTRADELGTQLNDPSFGQQPMTREMEVRLGQSKSGGLPIVQQLIERARAGDTAAQRVCEKRGIKWQP
jgi:hypothetical protein